MSQVYHKMFWYSKTAFRELYHITSVSTFNPHTCNIPETELNIWMTLRLHDTRSFPGSHWSALLNLGLFYANHEAQVHKHCRLVQRLSWLLELSNLKSKTKFFGADYGDDSISELFSHLCYSLPVYFMRNCNV